MFTVRRENPIDPTQFCISDVYGLKTRHKNVRPEMKIMVDTAKASNSVRGHILLPESVFISNL